MARRVKCPVCGARIEVADDVEDGESIICPECGAELTVVRRGRRISLKPTEEEVETEEE